MNKFSSEQEELKSSITKSAMIWGGVLGLVAGAITFWSTGNMDTGDRTQITGMAAGGIGFLMFWLVSRSKTKSSKCPECSAAFSISRTNREETLISSEEKSELEKLEGGGSKLSVWSEEKYDVVETYTCSSCGDVTRKTSQMTRKKDEVVKEKDTPKWKGDDVGDGAFVAKAGFAGGGAAAGVMSGGDMPNAPKSDDATVEKSVSGKAATKAKRAKSVAKTAAKSAKGAAPAGKAASKVAAKPNAGKANTAKRKGAKPKTAKPKVTTKAAAKNDKPT